MSKESSKPYRDKRRAALLETARKVFMEQGYFATTMEDIAVRHGGSKTTLYNYFSSKSDLFNAIIEVQSQKINEQLHVFNGMASDIRTVLQDFCRRCLTIMLSEDMVGFERLITAEFLRFPEAATAAYELGFKPGLEYWEKIVNEAIAAGQLRKVNAKTATAYLITLSEGPLRKLRLWGITKKITPKMIEYHAEAIVSIFLAAFGNDELAQRARDFDGLC